MRQLLAVLLLFALPGTAACDRPQRPTDKEPVPAIAQDDIAVASTSTGMVFDLSPSEKTALSEKALKGDPEASFRLAQYYGLAGGDNDANVNDEYDRQQERRWLELASRQGHRVAEFNLAVFLRTDDCPLARSMMSRIRDTSDDPDVRESASGWLDAPSFTCR